MVFGKIIRSIGLSNAQAAKEEEVLPNADSATISVLAEDSTKKHRSHVVSNKCSVINSHYFDDTSDQDMSEQATDTGDESEDSDASSRSGVSFHIGEVYPLLTLLNFRAVVDEQGAPDVVRAMTMEKVEQSSSRPSVDSPKSTSKAVNKRSQKFSPKATPKWTPEPVEALTSTAGSWAAAMHTKRSTSTPDLDDEQVTRKACLILNKLTVEKFDVLFEQLATCGITKPAHLEMLMREVFSKATMQHHFIAMYADLCVRLEQDTRISSEVEAAGQHQYSFRQLLLNQCQTAFENLLQPDDLHQVRKDSETDEEYALKRKQQALGNIKLIGQLLVHGMVTSSVLVECCEELLCSRNKCPEALESLAALLSVAGKQFDTESWHCHPRLLEVFSSMRKVSKDKSAKARDRFLLRDVLDMRDAGWPSCTIKSMHTTAPMKLDEVRESTGNVDVAHGKGTEDAAETNNLLAGLMRISKMANSKHEKDGSADEISAQAKPGWQKRPTKQPIKEEQTSNVSSLPIAALTSCPSQENEASSESVAVSSPPSKPFDVASFRRALATILSDLAKDKNVPAAVSRVREQDVPLDFQSMLYCDIITRIVEERSGSFRRCALAFIGGIRQQNVFDRSECLHGVAQFFEEVYPDLCDELQWLPAIATSELLPMLRKVFKKTMLNKCIPVHFVQQA